MYLCSVFRQPALIWAKFLVSVVRQPTLIWAKPFVSAEAPQTFSQQHLIDHFTLHSGEQRDDCNAQIAGRSVADAGQLMDTYPLPFRVDPGDLDSIIRCCLEMMSFW